MSPLTWQFPAAAPAPSLSPTKDALTAVALDIVASPSPSSPSKMERAFPSPCKPSVEKALGNNDGGEKGQVGAAATQEEHPQLIRTREEDGEKDDDNDEFEEDDDMRCSSAQPLVLPRCKLEPATTAAATPTWMQRPPSASGLTA